MKSVRVTTENPAQLREDINEKIHLNQIKTWSYDESKYAIAHTGGQYKGHFHFEYHIDKNKGILEFRLDAYGSEFAESKAVPFLEWMLTKHFGDRIEFIK